jgi:hypothetical protein
MKRIMAFTAFLFFFSCNDSSPEPGRPRDPNEAITDSTRIVGDSLIVPDTNNQGVDPTKNDTSKHKMN